MKHTPSRKSIAQAMLAAVVLTAGFITIWIVVLIAGSVLLMPFAAQTRNDQLVFTLDGRPLLASSANATSLTKTYRTLDGKRVDDPDELQLTEYSYLTYGTDLVSGQVPSRVPIGWYWRLVGFLPIRPAPAYWYLVHTGPRSPRAYFAGYDPQSKRNIGYIARRGFRPEVPPLDEQFEISTALMNNGGYAPRNTAAIGSIPRGRMKPPVLYLVDAGRLLRVNLTSQSVEPVDIPPEVVSVAVYYQPTAVPDERQATYDERLVVRMPGELRLLSLDGQPLRTIALPEWALEARLYLLGTVGDAVVLMGGPDEYFKPRQIDWIDPDGQITRHEQVSLATHSPDDHLVGWLVTGMLPMPAVALTFLTLICYFDPKGNPPTFSGAFSEMFGYFWLPYLLLLVLSLIAAALCYRRHRRIAPGEALSWAVFVFLLGPPAWVGYWTCRAWPARARCETCGAVVPRDRAACLECAAVFPPPQPKGIEVFA